ncbi:MULTISPECIES: hypothetical protein [Pseudoalteromonas]|uniref:Uncharacterized protein n=2 Tax=Pseudoalteromonas TaxID=53246 RepID=V4HZP1_PSEL2|nr:MULTISPECIES: hypothetical protein [Pseudoalteromonas]ESP93429.1 hypothetical protein PL2TA16_03282 [Pseudoalteromonas luteoviolacea 2ta16]KZN43903.1 hypothetical protein N483_08260 [Pseudoalteromonas luteoviolacea NCIMB 1944]MBQ4835249.1 hypothetical protein [Pseudoalteromonas luteoviolacea]MCG7549158.1 hypothetical protein [Pseudoalteromonas sp. Of7M-16]MDK2596647.1 hypothetical protein [Pseudoalteromonas sp. P94(2023)]
MKLKIMKKKIKNLSETKNMLNKAMTPNVGGGRGACSGGPACIIDDQPSETVTSGGVPVTF